MNYTLNNHLKYWIGEELYGFRTSPYEKYRVEVGAIDQDHYKNSSWFKEQLRTADTIVKEWGKDFVVMFSGGTDSEIVVRSFVAIGIKPTCVFLKFPNNLNGEDLQNALLVCNELGLQLKIIEHDLKEFFWSGCAADFSGQIHCRQIAYLNVYYNIQKLGVPAVMGGEMLIRKHTYNGKKPVWYYTFRENEDASAIRFSNTFNLPVVNEWFSYTPEMMAYYLEHADIKNLINGHNFKLSTVTTKNSVLKQLIPSLHTKQKTHGFEKLLGFNCETYETLYNTHPPRLENSLDGIMLFDLFKQLYGNKI